MQMPETLSSLVDEGILDRVLRPLKSGKEAQIFLVEAGGQVRVAKIYKNAEQRSFKQRAQYMEGRRTRSSRDGRAIKARTRHGRAQEEEAWKSTEVDILHRLAAQGVRVPAPYNYIDGVLIMDLVRGADGEPAPRLAELALDPGVAHAYFNQLLRDVVKMLCAGIVHGDLSDYNVLVDAEGPVIIDFPQSVEAASNRNARELLVRDVDNLSAFLRRCAPGARRRPFGQEIWAAYESNDLAPELELKGEFRRSGKAADVGALLEEIEDANEDERRRREARGMGGGPARRREVVIAPPATQKKRGPKRGPKRGSDAAPAGRGEEQRRAPRRSGPADQGAAIEAQRSKKRHGGKIPSAPAPATDGDAKPKRRRRRRRRGSAQGDAAGPPPQRNETHGGQAQAAAPPAPADPEAGSNAPKPPKPPKRRRRRKRKRGQGTAPSGAAPSVD